MDLNFVTTGLPGLPGATTHYIGLDYVLLKKL